MTFENTTAETLETMKYNYKNKVVTQSPSKGAYLSIKDVQQEQKGICKKQQTGKYSARKGKPEFPKEKTKKGDGRMRNEMARYILAQESSRNPANMTIM